MSAFELYHRINDLHAERHKAEAELSRARGNLKAIDSVLTEYDEGLPAHEAITKIGVIRLGVPA